MANMFSKSYLFTQSQSNIRIQDHQDVSDQNSLSFELCFIFYQLLKINIWFFHLLDVLLCSELVAKFDCLLFGAG